MQSVFFIVDIFEDNHNTVRDHFETDLVNVRKNMLLAGKNNNTQNVCDPKWFLTDSWEAS